MKSTSIFALFLGIGIFGSSNFSLGQVGNGKDSSTITQLGESNPLKDLDYPELQVVPRASDRLISEANAEDDFGILTPWSVQLSGLSTLATGLMARGRYNQEIITDNAKRDADNISYLATGIGGGWFLLSTAMTFQEPYRKGVSTLKKMKSGDRRNDLARERFSEEVLERQARLSKVIMYSSVVTNLSVNMAVYGSADRDIKNYALVSSLFSFLPLLFQANAITTYEKHQEYKRKIYAPISWIEWNSRHQEWTPQWAVHFSF